MEPPCNDGMSSFRNQTIYLYDRLPTSGTVVDFHRRTRLDIVVTNKNSISILFYNLKGPVGNEM